MATKNFRSVPQLLRKSSPLKWTVVGLMVIWTLFVINKLDIVKEDLRTKFPSFYLQSFASHHRPSSSRTQRPNYHSSAAIEPSNLTFVQRLLDLEEVFDYQCRTIQTKQSPGMSRSRMQAVDERIFQEPLHVESVEDEKTDSLSCQPLGLPVPQFKVNSDVDTSSLFFGAATTLDRLNSSAPYWARWLKGSEASLVAVIHWDPQNEPGITTPEQLRATSKWAEVGQTLRDHGLNVTLKPYMEFGEGTHAVGDSQERRHVSIAQAMFLVKEPRHEWFIVFDDDTFFVSLPHLLHALEPFDPKKPHFLGQVSESRFHFHNAAFMPFGGAGTILTGPVLKQINDHYKTCIDRPRDNADVNPKPPGGDMLLKFCVEEADGTSTTSLELLPGLHQVDLHGDPWGWYESGLMQLLTLHHYHTFAVFPMLEASLVTDVCGDCFLQRYRFQDETVFTNGVSIVKYPNGLEHIPFHKVEQTFTSSGPGEFTDSLGELRPKLTEGVGKLSWRFETAIKTDDGLVRQFYVSRDNEKNGVEGRPDSVYELIFHDSDSSRSLLHGWR
ncbi:MAG: hypothetical protein Q9157_006008 [Trypethelium eluteriae]